MPAPLNSLSCALRDLVPRDAKILLAVSGGSDSMGLMHMAAAESSNMGYKLKVGFVDHGLRDIKNELELVSKRASDLGLELLVSKIPKDEAARAKSGGSLQAWARDARYRLICDMAKGAGLDYVATGHTLDDQAETVLQRIIRGTGLDGLAGIPRTRPLDAGLLLIRPLLDVSREDIKDYLRENEVEWASDPSNLDPSFSRVRIRLELLPLLNEMYPRVATRLAALADDARGVSSLLDDRVIGDENIYKNLNLSGGIKVDYRYLSRQPKEIRHLVIRRALRLVNGDLRYIQRNHIVFIEDLISLGRSSSVLPLPNGITAYVDRGSFYVFEKPLPPQPSEIFKPELVEAGSWQVRFAPLGVSAIIEADEGYDLQGLVGRTKRPGDRVYQSTKKLKKVLTNAKVPTPYRCFVPLLAKGNQVVSCPYLIDKKDTDINVKWHFDPDSPIIDIDLMQERS